MMRYYFIVIVYILLLLTGCAHTPTPAPTTYQKISWQQRQASLKQMTHWNIAGAFSIRQTDRSAIASFAWSQQNSHYQLRIHSSLDLYGINIIGDPGHVTLWRAQNQHFTARNPEALMQQQLGWHLPISNLYYWARGLPAPGHYQAQFDTFGHLRTLTQQGWQIQYLQYTSVGAVDLPQVITLSNSAFDIKIVIKQWGF